MITVTATNTSVWLPDPSDHLSTESELPDFNTAVGRTFIVPRKTFSCLKPTKVTNLSVSLLQSTLHWTWKVEKWSINSLESLVMSASEDGVVTLPPGKSHFDLCGFIPSFLPETVQGDDHVSYTLLVTWTEHSFLTSNSPKHTFPYYLRRQYNDSMSLTISSDWIDKAAVKYTFSSDTIAFGEAISVKISVSPQTKSLRLLSVVFLIVENGRGVKVFRKNSYTTPELRKLHQDEVESIKYQGLTYKSHFYDSCSYGNLLGDGNTSHLTYEFDLDKYTSELNPSTKGKHPKPVSHVIHCQLRFSFLEYEGKTVQRRYFDHLTGTGVKLFYREVGRRVERHVAFPEKQGEVI